MTPVKRPRGRPPKHSPTRKRRKLITHGEDTPAEDRPPSPEQWARMASYKRFELKHGNETNVFARNDVVMVLPAGHRPMDDRMDDADFWMARIMEICADDPTNVWVKVQWFYKPEELAGKIRGFDIAVCGSKERIASDHEDIIPSTCCEDVVQMLAYDEKNLETPGPAEDEWYYRYTYHTRGKGSPCVAPSSTSTCTAKCKRGYNPDHDEMRVCAPCNGAFHVSCLKLPVDAATLDWELVELALPVSTPKRPAGRTPSPTSSQTLVEDMLSPELGSGSEDSSDYDYDALLMYSTKKHHLSQPARLITLARLPLMRGGPHGVAGNCALVLAARRMLALPTLPTDWQEQLGGAAIPRKTKRKYPQFYECPGCSRPI
ncbi:hypothetical protein AURDEDRAFT_183068 [Auricularia subglabra TFB-10046 SS5]|nr:hypothetical protein AURDEDRAFT_183068 [Auricularia subglabra TFB-10046 SS5]